MSTYKPHKPTFAFDTEEVDANPIEPTLGDAPTIDVEKPDEDLLERIKMERSLREMSLGGPIGRIRDDLRKKGINPVSTEYVRDATDKSVKAREFFETVGKTMNEEGYIDLTQPVTNVPNFDKRVDQYISSGLAEEVKDASGRRVGIKMMNNSDLSPMIDSAYGNIKAPEAMSDVAQSDYFSELTRNVISQLPVNDKGEIEYNGVPYHWSELYEAFYPVVADRAHEALLDNNKDYYNWAFEQSMGMSYEDWYKGYADKRVSEIEQKIIELRDAVAEETAQIAEGEGREVALSSGTLVPASLLGWASKEGARIEASKQFNDVLESINTFRNNDFKSGLNEGFDWVDALTLGIADLGTSYSQLQLLEKAKRGEALSNSESKVLELLQLTQEFEGIKKSLGWERNLRSSVGSGLGSTLAMAPSYALGIAGTSRIGTTVKLAANVAKNASKKAAIKQVGKNFIHNFGTSIMRGGAVAPLMPSTYSTGLKELQEQYTFNPDGTLKFEPKSKALAFMGGYIDTMSEYTSEVFGSTLGEIIGYGARAFGRVTRLNKVVDAVMEPVNTGLGKAIDKGLSYIPIEDEAKLAGLRKALRGMIVPNAELDEETKELMRMWGVQDGYVAEAASEVFGDLMSQVMRDIVGAKTDYSDFKDSTYWGTQLLVSVLYGGSMNTLAHIKEGVSDYQQLVDLGKYKKDILDKIESRELRNRVLAITADGSIEDMAKQLADIEWEKYHATDRAKVMDYIRAEMQIQVTAGNVEENGRVEAFVKEASRLSGVTYQGKGNMIIEIAADGRTYYLVDGKEADKSESSMLTCIDKETGEMKAIHSSKATTTSAKYFNDVLQEVYTSRFSVDAEATRISALQSSYGQMERPTAEIARDMMKQMGITSPVEGDVITMSDGRKATITQDLENGSYVVRLEGQVPLLFTIPFYSIQSSNPLTAEAQKRMIEGKVGSAANKAADVSAVEVENGDVTEETITQPTQSVAIPETAEVDTQTAEAMAQVEEQVANDTLDMTNVPTDAEGNVDFDAIDDPVQYATLYEREAGSKAEAVKEVADLKRNTLEAAAKLEEQAKNEITALAKRKKLKEAKRLRERAAFYDKVLPEFEEMEEEYASVVKNEYSQQVAEPTLRVLDAMAKKLGLKVRFVDEVRTASGEKANANINGNEVEIAFMERIKSIAFLMGHEFTHRMQDLSPEQYAEFKQMVKDFIGEEKWNTLVAQTAQAYAKQNQPFTVTLIEDEVTADAAGELVESNDAFLKYLEGKKEDKTLLMKVAEFLRDMVTMFNTANDRERERQYLGLLDGVNKLIESAASAEATGNGQRERFSISTAPTFYSNAEYAVRGIKQEKATPEQWLKMIEKAGGLKAGEDKWLGLSDWLKASTAKTLTKDEVLQYIAENDIQIEEVSYGDVADISREEIYESAEFAELREGLTEYDEDDNPYINRERYDELRSESYDFVDGFSLDYWGEELEVNSPAAAATYLGLTKADKEINETRLNYTTQGLSNKREIALVVPTIEPWNTSDNIHFGDAGDGRAVAWIRFGKTEIPKSIPMHQRVDAFDAPFKNVAGYDVYAPEGRGGKFSKDYVIYGKLKDGSEAYVVYIGTKPISKHKTLEEARNAMNEYYEANPRMVTRYERVLVIDEIQSKRHQEGRDKGYIDADIEIAIEGAEERLRQANKALELYRNSLKEKYGFKELKGSLFERIKMFEAALSAEERAEMERLGTERNDAEIAFNELASKRNGIPSAPFEKNWVELAFKRMLRYAAENGYDYVAWTTGDQQADRYDLGTKVNHIHIIPSQEERYVSISPIGGRIIETPTAPNSDIITSGEYKGKSLSEVYGKTLADKIMSVEIGADERISGDGLRIGGEGMRGFYDQMLPSFVKKYTKKWGAEVKDITMPELEENNTMHAVNVTDSMRESVMQGQPKFSLSEVTTQIFDAAKAKFGTTYDMREAGYILPDGSMLDFSGRHAVRGGDTSFLNGDRTVDHREISDIAYDNDDNETGIKTDLGDFLDRGAIRIDSGAGAINLNVAPTKAQKDKLKRLIERNDGYVYIDFGKGWDTEHYAEYEGARASRVLGDIDRYFDEGIKPTGNVRFSLQEVNTRFNEELATLTEENAREKILNVGTPSAILLACGIENKPIRLYGAKLLSKVRKHGYDLDDLKNLPLAMSEPIAVFNGSKPNSFAILTELRVGDNNILVALSVGKGGHDVDFNIISSVYDKRGDSVARWVNDGKMLWVDKKKALDYFSVSAPLAEAQNNQELISTTNIIQNFQNPKIEARNSLITPEMDAAYLDAVERGDMATAQRMVMEAAKLAMPNTKVVDEDGNPKEVWHGGQFGISSFIPKRNMHFGTKKAAMQRILDEQWGYDNWLVQNEDGSYSWKYEDEYDEANNVQSNMTFATEEEAMEDALLYFGNEVVVNPYFLNIRNIERTDDAQSSWDDAIEVVKAESDNVDGIVYENWYEDKGSDSYIAFNPNQIKSADPVTYDDAGNVIPLSERFNPEKEDIRYSIIGEIGAANLDTYGRYGSPMLALEMAREFEAEGKTAREIRLATNWERGKDGKWRYEIMDGVYHHPQDDDITAKEYRLADILDTPDLYKAYPYLKDLKVTYNAELKPNGRYNGKSIELKSTRTPEQINSTLIHEVQHAIQYAEMFAKGGSVKSIANELVAEGKQLAEEFKNTPNVDIIRKGYLLYQIARKAMDSVKADTEATEAYRSLAGEVEARNTQKRMGMTEEQRLETLLSATEDVARDAQRMLFYEAKGGAEDARYSIINDMTEEDAYQASLLEEAMRMEREATSNGMDIAQEIADATGWVHLADGTWKYYGEGKLEITDKSSAERAAFRWLESKKAIKVEQVRKTYAPLISDAKRVIAEIEKSQRAAYAKLKSNADKVEYILQGNAIEALPIEDQILVDIALGQRLKWNDGDGKRGLKTELGLESAKREKMGAVTLFAKEYLEDYVARLMERNAGYEKGLNDNDIRNAVIEVFSSFPSSKAAMEELYARYKPEIDITEALDALSRLEFERDTALAQIEAEYKEIFDDFDNNPDTYIREQQEAESYNANLDMYVGSLSKARKEVERLERQQAKRKLSDEEKMAAMRAVKSAVAKELRDGLGRYTRKYDIQRMMDAVSDARTPYAMLKAIDKAMESLFEIKWRREYARMQMLTKSKISYGVTAIDASSFLNTFVSDHKITAADARKIMNDYWRGTKANGVSVAKYIDDTTRQAMEFISEMAEYAEARARFSDIEATEIVAFTRKLREKLEDYTSLNDYKLKTALANDAVRKAVIDAVDILEMYWKAQELQLSLNDDKHRRDISVLEIKAKEITAQLREVNQQIKDLADGKVVVTSSGVKDRELLRKELQERYNTLLAEREEAYAEMYNAMPDIINLMQEANGAVETLLRTGKVNLAMERTKRKEHEKALIDDVLSDLASPASPQKHHIDIRNKSIFERIAAGIGSVIGAPLGSMDYMLRAIGRNAPLGEGRVYNRFAYAFQKAYDNIYTALEARKKMLDDKCNILWGENYLDVHKMAESTKVMTLTYPSAVNTRGKEWQPVENTTDIYVAQAMYILAMWNQAEGRVTLERQGFTDERISAVRDALNSIDPRWIEFADWVVEEYLPSGRERYNAVHRDIFGTSMAAVPNYFPIKRAKEKLHKEEDVAAGDADLLPSTVVGAIKERTSNVVPIDIETSFFEALNENTSVMEAWAEMAGLIQDINTILSNGAVKTTMLDINNTLFSDFKKAAQVATLSYIGKTPDIDKKVGTILNRLWAGSKIAFRLNTAFKQLSSALLFAGYSTDPKFQAILLWRYLGGVGKMPVALMKSIVDGTSHLTGHSLTNIDIMTNIEWAKANMPAFAKRWNEGVAGNELMARTTSGNTSWKQRTWAVKFDDAVRAVTKFGMKPNAFIDAFTSAAGARAVYDYTYEEIRKEGYSEEEAHTLAIINAEMAFNTTQQSSEGLYLAPMQVDRSVVATTLSTFMNAPYAMFRNTMIGLREIFRDAKKELAEIESLEFKKAMDIAEKQVEAQVAASVTRGEYSEEEAKKRRNELFDAAKEKIIPLVKDRAYNKYVKAQTKAVVMVFLNGYAGQVAFNLMGKLAEFMFGDDDEEKKKMLYDIAVKSAWEAPVSMMPLGGYVTSMVNGYSASFFPAMDELSKEISTIAKGLREEDISPEVIYAATTMCMRWGLGLSVDTIVNVALGIENMFEDGMSPEAILKVMNAPEGQIRNIVGQRKEGETAKEYNERVMRFYSILDTPIYEDYFYTHGEKAGERRNEEAPRGMFEKQMKRIKYEEAYRRSVVLHYGDGKQLAEIEDTRKAYNKLKTDGYGNMHEGKREVLRDITKVINEGEFALMRTVDKNEESYYSILLQVKKLQERYIELYEQFK